MKKTNIFKILLILTINLILIFSLVKVSAYDGPIDPDKKISFSMIAINGEGKIYVSTSVEAGYQLHYQPVEVPSTDFETYQAKRSSWDIEVEGFNTRLSEKNAEVSNLVEVHNQKVATYNQLVEEGAPEDEIEAARAAVNQAYEAVQAIEAERDAIIDEYNNRRNEILEEIRPLYQTFNNANWREGIPTETNKTYGFVIDRSEFSGEKGFAIWVRLIEADNTITYDRTIYTVPGSAKPKIDLESFTLDKTELSLNVDERYTLIPTFVPEDATNKVINWTSSNEDIATVLNGVVTGKSIGTATITATSEDGGFVVTCEVTVLGGKTQNNKEDNKEDNKEEDDTTAPTNLPKAGGRVILTVIIAGIIVLAIIYYKKYSKYNDVK